MSIDRELLELAAKAAGAKYSDYPDKTPNHLTIQHSDGAWRPWNPLTDDGDAMRLVLSLSFRLYIYSGGGDDYTVVAGDELRSKETHISEAHQDDRIAATRRAIVRAAAEIGRAMP